MTKEKLEEIKKWRDEADPSTVYCNVLLYDYIDKLIAFAEESIETNNNCST